MSADAGPGEARRAGESLRWGIGYYQNDDILLRRRPNDPRAVVPVGQMVADVHATQLVGYYGRSLPNAQHTDDTHPFRYRTWLFAHTGILDSSPELRERLLDELPDFLRAGIRGDAVSELLFHLFLADLHDQGQLQGGGAPDHVRNAVRHLVDRVEAVSTEVGAPRPELNVLVANGELMVAARTGSSMLFREVGRREIEDLFEQDRTVRRGGDWSSTRVSVIASHIVHNVGAYRAVPARNLLTLSHHEAPVCEPIDRPAARRVAVAA